MRKNEDGECSDRRPIIPRRCEKRRRGDSHLRVEKRRRRARIGSAVDLVYWPAVACKPNSVPACGGEAARGGDHFSCPGVAAGLLAAYPRRLGRPGPRLDAYLALLPVGFAVPRMSPPARCALTAPFHPCWRSCLLLAVSFCCTFRRIAPPRSYRAPCPVQFGLSSREPPLPGDPRAITAAAASQLALYVLRVAEF